MKKSTKKEYVLSQSKDLSAEEVVAKASEDGVSITKAYVYNIRSSSNLKSSAKRNVKRQIVRVNEESESFLTTPRAAPSRYESPRDMLVEAVDALIADRVRLVLSSLAVNQR